MVLGVIGWIKDMVLRTTTHDEWKLVSTILHPTKRFAVHFAPDQYISAEIAQHGVWEPFESRVFSGVCQKGDFVLDLGANIGWYSILAAGKVGPEGKVVSFEPDPRNLFVLRKNIDTHDEFGVVNVVGEAVADVAGHLPLHLSESNLGDHRLFSDGSPRASRSVSVTTLDSFFEDQPCLPNVVKSDTQGSEARILRGAKRLFERGWRPIIILEFWPFGLNNSGDDALGLWTFLRGLGYAMFEVSEGRHELVVSSAERVRARLLTDLSVENQGFINLLCIPAGVELMSDLVELVVER